MTHVQTLGSHMQSSATLGSHVLSIATLSTRMQTSAADMWADLEALRQAWAQPLSPPPSTPDRGRHPRNEPSLRLKTEAAVRTCAEMGRVRAVECLVRMHERKRAPVKTLPTFSKNPSGWKYDASLWTWAVRGAARAGLAEDVEHYKNQALHERSDADLTRFYNTGNALYFKGVVDVYACCKGYAEGGHLALLCAELCKAEVANLLSGGWSRVRRMLLRRYRVRLSVMNELMLIANKSYPSVLPFLADVYISSFTAR